MNAMWTGSGYSEPLTNEEQRALGLPVYKRFYRYINAPDNRLTLHYAGVQYRVPDNLIHDFGSLPSVLQGWLVLRRWFSKDSYPRSVVLHDAGYTPGHILWVSRDGGETWHEEEVAQALVDLLLAVGIRAEGGPRWVAATYYKAVSTLGWMWW